MLKDRKGESPLSDDVLLEAVSVLEGGGVVAFPTETYYGLGVDPFNEKAMGRLFEIKRRDHGKPTLLLIDDVDRLTRIAAGVPRIYTPLIEQYWPGPLTLIFPARAGLPALLTGATGGVGVRISSHPIARALCRRWGGPLPATSANISGASPAGSASAVRRIFGDDVDYIIDGGRTPAGKCSTIVGIRDEKLTLIRQGGISMNFARHFEKRGADWP